MVAAPVSAFTGRPVRGLAMSAKSPSTAKCSRSAASPRRCSPRTAAAWAASSCRWGTAGRSTRTSTTASGARSSSTTSRGPRSWVHLALHREEVVEPHPEQPRARGQHPRNASSAVSPAASNRAMNTSSKTRSRKRRGHRQHDREKWLESNPDGVLQDGRIRSIGRQVRTDRGGLIDLVGVDRGGLIDLVGVDRDGSVCNRRYGLNGTPFDDRTPRFRRMVTNGGPVRARRSALRLGRRYRRRVPGLLALSSSVGELGCPPSPERRDSVWR